MEQMESLLNGQQFKKFQEILFEPVLHKYHLTVLELRILIFLGEHENRNTASDIVDIHHLTKSNVSKAVENLQERGYIVKKQDEKDRRYSHLTICEQGDFIVRDAKEVKEKMKQILLKNVTTEEKRVLENVTTKIIKNIAEIVMAE